MTTSAIAMQTARTIRPMSARKAGGLPRILWVLLFEPAVAGADGGCAMDAFMSVAS